MRHWLRKQPEYRELPTGRQWWLEFEPLLVAGLEVRAMVMWEDEVSRALVIIGKSETSYQQWKPLVEKLINRFDAVIRRQREHPGGGEAAK